MIFCSNLCRAQAACLLGVLLVAKGGGKSSVEKMTIAKQRLELLMFERLLNCVGGGDLVQTKECFGSLHGISCGERGDLLRLAAGFGRELVGLIYLGVLVELKRPHYQERETSP